MDLPDGPAGHLQKDLLGQILFRSLMELCAVQRVTL
jgi:hypothetical protein